MSAATAPAPLSFELKFSRRGAIKKNGKWEDVPGRAEELDLVPTLYTPLTGTYDVVAKQASKLNEMQIRGSFIDYLFFPELVAADRASAQHDTVGGSK